MTKTCLLVLMIAAASIAGCGEDVPPASPSAGPRVVSFSPAITGILYGVGLGDCVVGVTTYCRPGCDNPPPVVGDRARVSAEAILSVRPDVLLVQQNVKDFGAVRTLAPKLRIEHFTIETLDDIAAAIGRIGGILGQEALAESSRQKFTAELAAVATRVAGLDRPSILFVIGHERPLTGGAGTFIDEMISYAGGVNAASRDGYKGWKNLNRENVAAMAPQVLICQVSDVNAEPASQWWRSLGDMPAARDGRIVIVTDPRWTTPSIWSASFTSDLAEIIHPLAGDREAGSD